MAKYLCSSTTEAPGGGQHVPMDQWTPEELRPRAYMQDFAARLEAPASSSTSALSPRHVRPLRREAAAGHRRPVRRPRT